MGRVSEEERPWRDEWLAGTAAHGLFPLFRLLLFHHQARTPSNPKHNSNAKSNTNSNAKRNSNAKSNAKSNQYIHTYIQRVTLSLSLTQILTQTVTLTQSLTQGLTLSVTQTKSGAQVKACDGQGRTAVIFESLPSSLPPPSSPIFKRTV
jgi:hypothetical protein